MRTGGDRRPLSDAGDLRTVSDKLPVAVAFACVAVMTTRVPALIFSTAIAGFDFTFVTL